MARQKPILEDPTEHSWRHFVPPLAWSDWLLSHLGLDPISYQRRIWARAHTWGFRPNLESLPVVGKDTGNLEIGRAKRAHDRSTRPYNEDQARGHIGGEHLW